MGKLRALSFFAHENNLCRALEISCSGKAFFVILCTEGGAARGDLWDGNE